MTLHVVAAFEKRLPAAPPAGPADLKDALAAAARLSREIGVFDATTLVVGSMIGSGIFIVSAESARGLGSTGWLLAAWAIAGLSTMVASLCCAELAAMLPRAGGQYVFFREAYGELAGFLFGWTLFLVVQTGTIAAVAVAFAKYLGVLAPSVSGSRRLFSLGPVSVSAVQVVALVVIALLTASNATGLKAGTRTQNVFTVAKFAALLALTAAGLALPRDGAALREPGFFRAIAPSGEPLAGAALLAALGTAMVGPLFSQSAWNNVTFAGEEVKDPGRTLPRALLAGCAVVTLLYVLANVAYANVLPLSGIQHAPEDRVATAVATALFGPPAAAAVAAAIMVSTFGCVNGLILSGARVAFAMARDGLFFRRVERINSAGVPSQRAVGPVGVGGRPRALGQLQRPPEIRHLGRPPFLRAPRARGRGPAAAPARMGAPVPSARVPVAAPPLRGGRAPPDRDPPRGKPPDDLAGVRDRRGGRSRVPALAPGAAGVLTVPARSTSTSPTARPSSSFPASPTTRRTARRSGSPRLSPRRRCRACGTPSPARGRSS